MKIHTAIITASIMALAYSYNAYAGEICVPVAAVDNEPAELIITEGEYTFANAMWAFDVIATEIDVKVPQEQKPKDYKSRANAEIVLKGYLLRSNCTHEKQQESCREFCEFMEKHRYWYE